MKSESWLGTLLRNHPKLSGSRRANDKNTLIDSSNLKVLARILTTTRRMEGILTTELPSLIIIANYDVTLTGYFRTTKSHVAPRWAPNPTGQQFQSQQIITTYRRTRRRLYRDKLLQLYYSINLHTQNNLTVVRFNSSFNFQLDAHRFDINNFCTSDSTLVSYLFVHKMWN